MSDEDQELDRFDRIMKLTPRRFHISASPPFAAPYDNSFVLCGQVNGDEDDGSIFGNQRDGIRNCKPGIWTSRTLPVSDAFKLENFNPEDGEFEALLYWVTEGTVDLSQSVEDWEAYEASTAESDAAVPLKTLFPKGTQWKRSGSYYDDGGVLAIISTDYLSRDAASKIMGVETEDEECDLGYYYDTLTYDHDCFTLGGMSCTFPLTFVLPNSQLTATCSWPRRSWWSTKSCGCGRKWTSGCCETLHGR
jgi:hypothetical protein